MLGSTHAKEVNVRSLLVVGLLISSCVAIGASAQSRGSTFVLSVDREGSFSLAGTGVALNEASVIEQAVAVLSRDADTALIVESDERAPLESVKRAAVLLQAAGALKISFRTQAANQP
jgi:biopolymer transport protein ExbD